MQKKYDPPQPVHIGGTTRGERMAADRGREPGRGYKKENKSYRSARDSTGINAKDRDPIDPSMINIPPA